MNSVLKDRKLAQILSELKLTVQNVMEKNENFLLLKCADPTDRRLVLKYSHSGVKDASARLQNEAVLIRNLQAARPLRLLQYYSHGPDYLVTEFEEGDLLLPNSDYRETIRQCVADALIKFQVTPIRVKKAGVRQKTCMKSFYLKGLLKHLLHLWPDFVSLSEAMQCLRILISALPAMGKNPVICHGDFLPTNLLFKAEQQEVVFTDLEGFQAKNHPFYDVLSFCTIDDCDLWQWKWQKQFIRYYLERTEALFSLEPASRSFKDALRGILIFLLVYRMNETRIGLRKTTYFDGLGKLRYASKRFRNLLFCSVGDCRPNFANRSMRLRKNNLEAVLSSRSFLGYLDWLLEVRLPEQKH
ncbi:MAG: phosphotransferase [Deltaproteobacteria bacterium]|nr:phosphotransferase [Deltaproteobacteria bacterium]